MSSSRVLANEHILGYLFGALSNEHIPGYLFGAVGEVISIVGSFSDPEQQAFYTTDQRWELIWKFPYPLSAGQFQKDSFTL